MFLQNSDLLIQNIPFEKLVQIDTLLAGDNHTEKQFTETVL